MRRKSSRNLGKSAAEKAKPIEVAVRKSRRTTRRRKRSSSSGSENSEEEPEIKAVVNQASAEESGQVPTNTDNTEAVKTIIDQLDIDDQKQVISNDPSVSPEIETKENLDKSENTQREKVSVLTRSSRRRASPKEEEATCREGEEDKKGKGKSKGKNKSKIEKNLPLNESEARNESEISENVQVTPESPQTNTDNPVDNEHVSVIEIVENSEEGNKSEPENIQIEETVDITSKSHDCERKSSSKEANDTPNNKSKSKVVLKLRKRKDISSSSDDKYSSETNSTLLIAEQQNLKNECIDAIIEKVAEENSIHKTEVNESSIGTCEEKSETLKNDEQSVEESGNENPVLEEIKEESNVESAQQPQLICNENNITLTTNENDQALATNENDQALATNENDQASATNESEQIVATNEDDQTIASKENDATLAINETEVEDMKVNEETNNDKVVVVEEQVITRDELVTSIQEINFRSEEDGSRFKEQPEIKPERKLKIRSKQQVRTSETSDSDENRESVVQRRRWGNSSIGLDLITPCLVQIDIDVIKTFCPNFKFLEESEVKLEHSETRDRRKSLTEPRERRKSERKVSLEESSRPMYENQLSESSFRSDDNLEPEIDNSNIIAMNRKISIVDDSASKLKPPPSPARNSISDVLYITNLVRPFTLKQLKELLERTGKIKESGFWTDRIKSKCYVQYETVDEAESTRNALHGVHWPIGNGKKLIIDYANKEDLENARNPPPPPPPPPQVPTPPAVPDVNKTDQEKEPQKKPKHEEEHKVKEKEREREKERHRSEHVREWDLGKENLHRRRSRSHERHEKRRHSHHSASPIDDFITRKHKKMEEQVPQKLMDDLFQKTKATPSIYWQPLTPEEIATKQQQRLERMAEHKRRMEETTRNRADYGRGGPYRRRFD